MFPKLSTFRVHWSDPQSGTEGSTDVQAFKPDDAREKFARMPAAKRVHVTKVKHLKEEQN